MQYDEALEYLDDHINLEATAGWVHGLSLDAMTGLVHLLGQPQLSYPVIHITGTNGKGSTGRMISALLVEHGLTVGTYSSPHLERYNERIQIDGEPLSDEDFAEAVEAVARVEDLAEHRPSHFEVLTGAALGWFAQVAVDVAVIEVGLLGRYDATNVVDASWAVITNIGRDHTDFEGDWRAKIAGEKAGIIKAQSQVIIGETDSEVVGILRREPSGPVWQRDVDFSLLANRVAVGGRQVDMATPHGQYDEVFIPVFGAHQGDNALVATAVTEAFFDRAIDFEVLEAGFGGLTIPGRAEIAASRPLVLLDGAHNPDGAESLAAMFSEEFVPFGQRIVVLGMLNSHDPASMLEAFGFDESDLVIATRPDSPRGRPADEVARLATEAGLEAEVAPTVAEAMDRAYSVATEDDMILVTGSLYTVGEARPLIHPD